MQRAWAIDGLIVNDGTSLRSVLTGGVGLPQATVRLARRYGRWPVAAGVDRPGMRLSLMTLFKHAIRAMRYAARRNVLQCLNPELEVARRLVVTDTIIEGVGRGGMLLALGPWDVYQDGDGDWHARDLLQPDTVEADITALGDFADGRGAYTRGVEVTGSTVISLDDDVGLISGVDTLSFRIVVQMPYAHDSGGWPGARNYLWDARGASDSHRIGLYYDTADDRFKLYVNGAVRLESAVQTFGAGDWMEIVVTLDYASDVYTMYLAGASVDTDATALTAPTLTAWRIGSDYAGTQRGDFVIQEYQVAGVVLTAAAVEAVNGGDLRARWMDVLCEASQPWAPGGIPSDRGVVSSLVVDGDVRWRSRDGDKHVWSITSGTDSETVTVDSDDDVYPVLRITPKQAKSSGYAYRRWVPVIWTVGQAYSKYPCMIGTLDTAALVTAGKAQADGDDFRVLVDGTETDRWFGDSGTAQFNQTATKTWVNLDFQAGWEGTLEAAIGSGDTVDSIDVNEDISAVPSSGILVAYSGSDYEAFTYTGKNESERRFTGVSRAAKGTSALTLGAGASIYWVQHDVWLVYGNSGVGAPTQDDDYKPAFDLGDSTNTSWVYEGFGEDDGLRTGQWVRSVVDGSPTFYGGNHGASADPWIELGISASGAGHGRIYMYNPCGITNANFTNGEKRSDNKNRYDAYIKSRVSGSSHWGVEYQIPFPMADNVWESWSCDVGLASSSLCVALECYSEMGTTNDVEVADCTLTLNSSNVPTHEIGDEIGSYELDCIIANETTEEGIALNLTMGLETLEVDTDNETIILLADGSSQIQALTLIGGARPNWLRLVDGENELTFEDAGTVELEVVLVWDRRLFE